MNNLSGLDQATLQGLGVLLEEECAVLANVRVNGPRLGEIIAAKSGALKLLGQWPTGRYRDNHEVQRELKRLALLNHRNGRMIAIRRRSNRRILDAVSAIVGGGLYGRGGTTRP